MPTELIHPDADDGPLIAPCPDCGTATPTRYAIKGFYVGDTYEPEATVAVDMCVDCKADLDKRAVEYRIDAARRRAKYEKTLADLLNSIPKKTEKQIGLDMGLD